MSECWVPPCGRIMFLSWVRALLRNPNHLAPRPSRPRPPQSFALSAEQVGFQQDPGIWRSPSGRAADGWMDSVPRTPFQGLQSGAIEAFVFGMTPESTVEHCYGCSVTKSCWTLCDPVDCSPPGSSVHRILQAKVLE